jgi:small subunit ribosomal protein S9
MADDETQNDETTEPEATEPEATEPEAEAPAEDAPEEGTPEDETPAEDAPAEDAPEAEAPAEETPEAEAPAEEAPEAEAPAEEAPEAEAPAAEKPKAKDAPPGAELEPIAIEPEREMSAEERARAEAEAEERAQADAVATDEVSDEPVARKTVEVPAETNIQATGKRKSSIARVVLRAGDGTFEINSRPLEDYFPRFQHQALAKQPLVTAGYEGAVDVRVRVRGGGISGQAGAVRHGVARALTEVDPELRGELKRRGLLTRDDRRKERRKAGLKKARKRPQFSKR